MKRDETKPARPTGRPRAAEPSATLTFCAPVSYCDKIIRLAKLHEQSVSRTILKLLPKL